MSTVAFARIVRKELAEALENVEAGILGGVKSMDEYRELVGKRQGLQRAIAVIDETTRQFDEQE